METNVLKVSFLHLRHLCMCMGYFFDPSFLCVESSIFHLVVKCLYTFCWNRKGQALTFFQLQFSSPGFKFAFLKENPLLVVVSRYQRRLLSFTSCSSPLPLYRSVRKTLKNVYKQKQKNIFKPLKHRVFALQKKPFYSHSEKIFIQMHISSHICVYVFVFKNNKIR